MLWIPVVIRVTEVVTPHLKHKAANIPFQDSCNLKDTIVSCIYVQIRAESKQVLVEIQQAVF